MTDAPLLSICIPAYNRPLWLRRGLQSIVVLESQYQCQVEVVLTDDSDQPDADAIAKEVLRDWQGPWQYEFHPQRLGMAQNWNRAIALATGRYVMVLHDDDFFLDGGLKRLLTGIKRLGSQSYPVLLFGVVVVDEQERRMKRQVFTQDQFLPPKQALLRLFSDSSFVRFPAIAFQRSTLETVGYFRPEWREPCDVEMWMRLFGQYGVFCLRESTVAYRVHSQALTMAAFQGETITLLLNLFSELDQLGLLNKEEIASCRGLFLHQFILAGAWRQLRRGRWQEFKKVMDLLNLPTIQPLPCPPKWQLLRIGFKSLSLLFAQF